MHQTRMQQTKPRSSRQSAPTLCALGTKTPRRTIKTCINTRPSDNVTKYQDRPRSPSPITVSLPASQFPCRFIPLRLYHPTSHPIRPLTTHVSRKPPLTLRRQRIAHPQNQTQPHSPSKPPSPLPARLPQTPRSLPQRPSSRHCPRVAHYPCKPVRSFHQGGSHGEANDIDASVFEVSSNLGNYDVRRARWMFVWRASIQGSISAVSCYHLPLSFLPKGNR